MAGIVFTQVLNDELARPDYNTNSQHRLTSYSMQNDNTYAYPDDNSHNDFSGYYIKVSECSPHVDGDTGNHADIIPPPSVIRYWLELEELSEHCG